MAMWTTYTHKVAMANTSRFISFFSCNFLIHFSVLDRSHLDYKKSIDVEKYRVLKSTFYGLLSFFTSSHIYTDITTKIKKKNRTKEVYMHLTTYYQLFVERSRCNYSLHMNNEIAEKYMYNYLHRFSWFVCCNKFIYNFLFHIQCRASVWYLLLHWNKWIVIDSVARAFP